MTALDRIRVVLVEPQDAANVGAAARAMKNMGLARLVVTGSALPDMARAATMAVHAGDVLARLRLVGDLAEAVADCGLVVGTVGRATAVDGGVATPRVLAPEIVAAAAANEVALVFGREDRGLSNAELARCQRWLTVPTSAAYASLNLAQAVVVCAYEVAAAALAPPPADARLLAASARQELMYAKLEAALLAIGFLHADTVAPMMRKLRRTLGRAALDDDEVQVVLGMARQMEWAARRRARN